MVNKNKQQLLKLINEKQEKTRNIIESKTYDDNDYEDDPDFEREEGEIE